MTIFMKVNTKALLLMKVGDTLTEKDPIVLNGGHSGKNQLGSLQPF